VSLEKVVIWSLERENRRAFPARSVGAFHTLGSASGTETRSDSRFIWLWPEVSVFCRSTTGCHLNMTIVAPQFCGGQRGLSADCGSLATSRTYEHSTVRLWQIDRAVPHCSTSVAVQAAPMSQRPWRSFKGITGRPL
jgi:hypothetical protein